MAEEEEKKTNENITHPKTHYETTIVYLMKGRTQELLVA